MIKFQFLPDADPVNNPLAHARIRNRIIEVLNWIVDSRSKIPDLGFDELVNSWADWATLEDADLPLRIFTSEEIAGIRNVEEAIDAFCRVTPQSIPNTQATLQLAEWAQVSDVAELTLSAMMKRGKSIEDAWKIPREKLTAR